MQGRRSVRNELAHFVNNIHRRDGLFEEKFRDVYNLASIFEEKPFIMAAEAPKKLGDFARPTFGVTASAIVLSDAGRNYELRHNHISQLPSFYGMPNEDALLFIREFCTAVHSLPLLTIGEDELLRKCFPYSLKDRAKTWFLSLAHISLPDWPSVSTAFLLKYYPNNKTQDIRLQIMQFTQEADEPFHEALDRFRGLLLQCPHHQIVPELLWQIFYNGLLHTYQFMVDTVAGGKISSKTAEEAVEIFDTLAANSQQKTTRSTRSQRMEVKEVGASTDLRKQMTDMMRELQELKMKKDTPPVRQEQSFEPCPICGDPSHDENSCNRMAELTYEGGAEVYATQGFVPRQQFEQNSYQQNSSWRPQNNGGWRNQNQGQGSGSSNPARRYQPPQQQFNQSQQQYHQQSNSYYPPQQQQFNQQQRNYPYHQQQQQYYPPVQQPP